MELLDRKTFRESVLSRDGHTCVICGLPAVDAHHVLERRLWKDGGYYLDNGVSLCSECHIAAEKTEIGCTRLRAAAGITSPVMPEHFYPDECYDKWGNILLSNGTRLKGDLYGDEAAMKAMGPSVQFATRVKYPRTYHFPWSENLINDDRMLGSLAGLEGQGVVGTVKMDGENTSLYRDGVHARSLDYNQHPSRNAIKELHGRIGKEIPEGWRICGENLFAKHSIYYANLPDLFLVFSIWNEKNVCLSWQETEEWCQLLDLHTVPVIYLGMWDEEKIKSLYSPFYGNDPMEGYVIRVAGEIRYSEFKSKVGKFVRKNHVQTDRHWMKEAVIPNKRMP